MSSGTKTSSKDKDKDKSKVHKLALKGSARLVAEFVCLPAWDIFPAHHGSHVVGNEDGTAKELMLIRINT